MMTEDCRKHRSLIIFLRCEGAEVAVKAAMGTSERIARSSPMCENISLKAPCSLITLAPVAINAKVYLPVIHFIQNHDLAFKIT